jgi:hypothetical protein
MFQVDASRANADHVCTPAYFKSTGGGRLPLMGGIATFFLAIASRNARATPALSATETAATGSIAV